MKQVIEHGHISVAGQEYEFNTVYPMGRLRPAYWIMQVRASDGTEHNFATPEAYGEWVQSRELAAAWCRLVSRI